MPLVIACSACQGKLSIPESLSGKAVKCPKCGQTIHTAAGNGAAAPAVAKVTPAPAKPAAPAAARPAAKAAAAPAAAPAVADVIAVSCAGCQKKLQVKAAFAGKAVKCPGCGKPIKVPAPSAPADDGEEWTEINEEAAPPPTDVPAAAPKRGTGPVGEWGENLLEEQGVAEEMRDQFRAELTKTERIVWVARPRVDILLHRARLVAYIAGPICILVALIGLAAAILCVINGVWFGLIGLVFTAIAGVGAFFVLRMPGNVTKNADKRACYAITNRRLLINHGKVAQVHIGSGGMEAATTGEGIGTSAVTPYTGLELTRIMRVDAGQRFPGAGDIWMGRGILEDAGGWGLQAVDNVRDVERSIREKLIHPVIEKLLRGELLSKDEKGKKDASKSADVIAPDSNIKEYGGSKKKAPEFDPDDPNLKAAPGQDLKAVFAAALKKVPAEVRESVDAEMTAGEKVLWIGRPEAGVKGRGFLGSVMGSAKRYEPNYTHYALTNRRVILFIGGKAPLSYYTPTLMEAGVETDDRIPNGGGIIFRKVKRVITTTDNKGKSSTRVEMHHFGLLRIRNYKAVAAFLYETLIAPCKAL